MHAVLKLIPVVKGLKHDTILYQSSLDRRFLLLLFVFVGFVVGCCCLLLFVCCCCFGGVYVDSGKVKDTNVSNMSNTVHDFQ